MSADDEITVQKAIKNHFGLTGFAAGLASFQFQASLIGRAWHPFRGRSKAEQSLDEIEDAIKRIGAGRSGITPSVAGDLMGYFCKDGSLPEKGTEDEILRSAMMLLIFEPEKLLPAIDSARGELSKPDNFTFRSMARVNVKAIQTVDAAIALWDRIQNRPAPRKSLNPETPFAYYLQDMLIASGVEGDAKSTHRAWAQTYGAASEH
jgi:hypothetical protein